MTMRYPLAAVLAVMLALPAAAHDFEKGWNAFERGDHAAAEREWRLFAEQGDANAQFNLGLMYATGKGVAQDSAEAVKWFRKAAEQGVARAQYNLGHMYETGDGVAQDSGAAVQWFLQAAEQGVARAQYNLGLMCREGRGVPRDYAKAMGWFQMKFSAKLNLLWASSSRPDTS